MAYQEGYTPCEIKSSKEFLLEAIAKEAKREATTHYNRSQVRQRALSKIAQLTQQINEAAKELTSCRL